MTTTLTQSIKFDSLIDAIKLHTHDNAHNEARRTLASYLGHTSLTLAYDHLISLQLILGHMPQTLLEFRRIDLDSMLTAYAKAELSTEDYNRIKEAF